MNQSSETLGLLWKLTLNIMVKSEISFLHSLGRTSMGLKGSGEKVMGLTCQTVTLNFLHPLSALSMQAQHLNFVLGKEVLPALFAEGTSLCVKFI